MKQLIKAILPRPVLHAVLDVRDMTRLAALPRQNFNPSNLRTIDALATDSVFRDEEIMKGWYTDHEAVTSVFGNDDRFGGVNPGDRRALYYLVRALKPLNVLEVGTHIGASTLYIARALKSNGNKGTVTTVDILDVNDPVGGAWKKVGLAMAPQDLANQISCRNQIEFVAANSLEFLKQTGKQYDFIFLDGDHRPHTVYQEVAAALKALAPEGVILLHDYYPDAKPLYPDDNIISGPFRALARIKRENPDIQVRPLGNLPWPTKQGTNMTSLALLTRRA